MTFLPMNRQHHRDIYALECAEAALTEVYRNVAAILDWLQSSGGYPTGYLYSHKIVFSIFATWRIFLVVVFLHESLPYPF